LCSCLLLALGLSACGGGGSSDDEAQIVTTLKSTTLSPDPNRCTELNTEAYVEQTTHLKGEAALKACEEKAETLQRSELPDSIKVTNVEIDGEKATADVAFVGGTFDRQVVTTGLRKEEGQWKVDELRGFAHLDRDAMAKTFERAFEEAAATPLPAAQLRCLVEGFRNAPTKPLEELLMSESKALQTQVEQGCGLAQPETSSGG
jgi:hypothetical protein